MLNCGLIRTSRAYLYSNCLWNNAACGGMTFARRYISSDAEDPLLG
jgi:hypothetical protein